MIVTIEGVDAVGKHTQSSLLWTWLKSEGRSVESISFPDYETPIGKEIRSFLDGKRTFGPEVRHMLFAANRWEKVQSIRKARDENEVVIIDRYTESNLAYGVANGLPLEWLLALEEGLPKSDLVIVLDAPSAGLQDRREGPKDFYERDSELQTRVQASYRMLATKFGWVTLDASRSVEAVHGSLKEVVGGIVGKTPGARP
jgi:dTMP kinase